MNSVESINRVLFDLFAGKKKGAAREPFLIVIWRRAAAFRKKMPYVLVLSV
jgi:hypothetical protein